MISVENVDLTFETNDGPVHALKEVSLDTGTSKNENIKAPSFDFDSLPNTTPAFNPIPSEEDRKKKYEAMQKEYVREVKTYTKSNTSYNFSKLIG